MGSRVWTRNLRILEDRLMHPDLSHAQIGKRHGVDSSSVSQVLYDLRRVLKSAGLTVVAATVAMSVTTAKTKEVGPSPATKPKRPYRVVARYTDEIIAKLPPRDQSYHDGGGLKLAIRKDGTVQWYQAVQSSVTGRFEERYLGKWPYIKVAEARVLGATMKLREKEPDLPVSVPVRSAVTEHEMVVIDAEAQQQKKSLWSRIFGA